MTLDTETCNTLDDPLVYDLGGVIHDKKGNVVETFSFVIDEIFNGEKELMKDAYFAEFIPQYEEDIKNGTREVVSFFEAKKRIRKLCWKYHIWAIIAHNMRFDYKSLTTTQRYLTKSKWRWFLPWGVPLWDTMRMAESCLLPKKSYREFCEQNGYMTKRHKPRLTAEVIYQYMTQNTDFAEEHKGLQDALIEKDIFAYCMTQKVKLRKRCFN